MRKDEWISVRLKRQQRVTVKEVPRLLVHRSGNAVEQGFRGFVCVKAVIGLLVQLDVDLATFVEMLAAIVQEKAPFLLAPRRFAFEAKFGLVKLGGRGGDQVVLAEVGVKGLERLDFIRRDLHPQRSRHANVHGAEDVTSTRIMTHGFQHFAQHA